MQFAGAKEMHAFFASLRMTAAETEEKVIH